MAALLIFVSWLMIRICASDKFLFGGISEGPANMTACEGDTEGTRYLRWRHNGWSPGLIGPERYSYVGKTAYGYHNLQILNVESFDAGVYECVYYNQDHNNIGKKRDVAIGQLTVVSRWNEGYSDPYCANLSTESVATPSSARQSEGEKFIIQQPTHATVLLGETANFTCVVRTTEADVSKPYVDWHRWNGIEPLNIFNGDKYGVYSDRHGVNVLQIRNATAEDSGSYSCNTWGDRSWSRSLTVIEQRILQPSRTTQKQKETTMPTNKDSINTNGSSFSTSIASFLVPTVQPEKTLESSGDGVGLSPLAVIAAALAIAFAIFTALVATWYFMRRRPLARRTEPASSNGTAQAGSSGPENAALLHASDVGHVYDPIASAELDPSEITILRRVASGITSEVSQALLSGGNYERMVAVKKITNGHYDFDDLKNEVRLIASCSHPNVVTFVGHYGEADGKTLYLVTEFMDGPSLYSYLRNGENNPTIGDAFRFMEQIVDGMLYLTKQHIIHRDLAARNCMLNKGHSVLKIADFGLSRRSDADYVYVSFRNAQGLLPFRWMAPECFDSEGGTTYSEKSDVWAFGVTLWEIFTRSSPFSGMSQADVRRHIDEGKRLEDPKICPEEVRALMHQCWAQNPRQRPTFSQIKEDIAEINRRYGGDAEYTRQQYEVVTIL